MKFAIIISLLLFLATTAFSAGTDKSVLKNKKAKFSKTQEVNFDDVEVQGVTRRPEGMFLVQKKGIDFDPLYKVRSNFDRNIKESIDYLR